MALRTGFDPDGEMTSWVVNRSSGWIANGALNQSFLPVQILVNNVRGVDARDDVCSVLCVELSGSGLRLGRSGVNRATLKVTCLRMMKNRRPRV